MKKELGDLTNNELVRLLLRILWQMLDVGGVSGGRASHAVLLEAANSILPLPEDFNLDYFEDALLKEAMVRISSWPSVVQTQLSLFSDQVEFQTNSSIACLLLLKLQTWYREDAGREDSLPITERRLVDITVGMFCCSDDLFGLLDKSRGTLLEETRKRADILRREGDISNGMFFPLS